MFKNFKKRILSIRLTSLVLILFSEFDLLLKAVIFLLVILFPEDFRTLIRFYNKFLGRMYNKDLPVLCHRFVSYSQFVVFVHAVVDLRFFVRDNEVELNILYEGLLAGSFTLDRHLRFPLESKLSPERYIDVDSSLISLLLQGILSVVDLPSRYLEKNSEFLVNSLSGLNDSKRKFTIIKSRLSKILRLNPSDYQLYGIYNRNEFEKIFGLFWVDTDDDKLSCM